MVDRSISELPYPRVLPESMLNEVYKAAKLVGTTFYLLHTGGYTQTNPLTSLVMAPTCSYCSTCSPSILIPQLGFQENDTLRSGILYILHINNHKYPEMGNLDPINIRWNMLVTIWICLYLEEVLYLPPKWCPGITLRCVDQQRSNRSNIWEQPNDVQNKCITLRKRKQQQKKHLSHANQPQPHQPCLTLPKMCYFRRKSAMLAWAKRGHQSHGATPVWLILTNHQRNECKHSFVSSTQ
jgi:hypothetical protein